MQQMWRYGVAFIFLFICSVQDYKEREISLKNMICFILIGIVLNSIYPVTFFSLLFGILPGIILLFLSWITGWQIGIGDGLVMIVIGIILANKEPMGVLLTGFFLCACSGIFLFFGKKLHRKKRIPFVPYLFLGFFINLWMGV